MSTQQPTVPKPRTVLSRYWARVDIGQISPVLDRLWAKVDIGEPDVCWPFTGALAKGYGRIGLGGQAGGTANAHRVVAEAILGIPNDPAHQVRHLCGNRACCNPKHLAWGDQSANEMDKVAHGRSNRGERHGHARLSREQVLEIRERYADGETMHALGREFCVAWQTVQEIVHLRTWKWLDSNGEVMPSER